ncbi:MAG: gliding motility-associated-like protein, partial [Granulosicoccus sp.]
NPGAWDEDGDSLSYELVTCLGLDGLPIDGYDIPNGVTIDVFTGDMVWQVPLQQGEFNYAIRINEWRNGILVGHVLRDMQVDVLNCDNNPPIVESITEICVEAGQNVEFEVIAYDPDGDPVILTATGGPLQVADPATFIQPVSNPDTARSDFSWNTKCHHVQVQPYTMSFRAEDVPASNQPELVDYHTVFITVIGPAPQNPTATPQGNTIILDWEPSICQEVTGYKIYRRIEEFGFIPDTCETGVPAYTGYAFIGSTTGLNATNFTDNNSGAGLTRGIEYCYMVVACFENNGGAESYASIEFCAELKRDLPIITNVSVRNTDLVNGSMDVVWSAPTELDLIQVPGPHEYHLFRLDNGGGTEQQISTLFGLNDTIFVDSLINTEELEFTYRVELFNDEAGNNFTVGSSDAASSVYLNTAGGDNTITLTWNETVPWINDTFNIYKQNADLTFSLIGITTEQTYTDIGLANGVEYCYRVESDGHYSVDSIIDPILNWSQISCTEPIDTFPPCPQDLTVDRDCDLIQNNISWENPAGCPDDIVEYQLFYTPIMNGNMVVVSTTSDIDPLSFEHILENSIAGCYSVMAVDSFQNTSMSDTICVDNCVEYVLPNVFTPNGDAFNNFFEPFPYRFIDHIDMTIYNRWGLVMYKTQDPDVLWDGTSKQTGQKAPDGVYFYTCTIFEIRLEGIVERPISGYVHILASQTKPAN